MLHKATRFPAEWERQSALFMTWPHAETNWQPDPLAAEDTFLAIAKTASKSQKLVIACNDQAHGFHVESLFRRSRIDPVCYTLYVAPSNDSWARDHGPIGLLRDGNPHLIDFKFNGWTCTVGSTEVRLHRDEGPTVQVQPLPYSLNAA